MSKELVVSSTPHETKVAILEDDEVVEVYFEREQEYSLAGSIYKGRVTRVLPGMQSAFVDIGLERDAFLYVSDFFEDAEEYEQVVATPEEKAVALSPPPSTASSEMEPPVSAPAAEPSGPIERTREPADRATEGRRRRRSRHHRTRGRGFPESKYASPVTGAQERPRHSTVSGAPPAPVAGEYGPAVLPGESLAKYRDRQSPATPQPEPVPEQPSFSPSEPLGQPEPASSLSPPAEGVPSAITEPEGIGETHAEPLPDSDTEEFEAGPVTEEAGDSGEEGAPASAEASVREPAETSRYSAPLSRRMRRKMMREQRLHPREAGPAEALPSRSADSGSRPSRGPLIGELLREGQEIIVQIAKEPLGKKGARITSHIALPGRYLVYMPTVEHIGVSRRIAPDEERQRLKRLLTDYRRSVNMTGGFIVRTAAEGHSEQDLRADMQFLFNLWKEIRAQAECSSAPALLHRDLNLVERILRDQVSKSFSTIWVDSEAQFSKILEFVQHFQPSLVGKVKLYLKDTPIFEEFGVQEEIDKSLKPKVWLKSGGYIVINQTEALVAIDVNTGKYVGRTQRLEDTIVRTNVDAIREIVRQIRLRDLGGIIVIDFIDMDERKNRQRVMQALEEALRQDRAPSKALAFNDFGLVAITRKRVKQPLERTLGCPCPYCKGAGFVKNVQTVGLEIFAETKKMLSSLERREITLRVNPEVARYLKQPDVTIVQEIEEMARKTVIIKTDASLHQESFDIH